MIYLAILKYGHSGLVRPDVGLNVAQFFAELAKSRHTSTVKALRYRILQTPQGGGGGCGLSVRELAIWQEHLSYYVVVVNH